MGSGTVKGTQTSSRRPWWRWLPELWDYPLFRWLAPLVLLYSLWCGFAWRYQDKLLFPSPKGHGRLEAPRGAELWRLELGGGRTVPAVYYPPRPGGPGVTVVYFHGNGETIESAATYAEPYLTWGCGVLVPEYRGFGEAAGRASQRAILDDAVRFYDRLLGQPGVTAGRIVFHGRSLGGGVAAGLAARRRPGALILESTFTSITAYFRRLGLPPFLCRHPFRTDRVVRRLDVPMLILHGNRDVVVPVEHGRRLAELAPGATYLEFPAGHNDLPGLDGEVRYTEALAALLERTGATVPH